MPQENFVAPWKKWARMWQKLGHPSRPCRKNIQDYKRFLTQAIRGKEKPQALIFGATPELRDLLARYPQISVTIADINFEMILAMTELMRYKQAAEKEIWIRHHWLDLPLPRETFDVLLGDYILENLSHKEQKTFFQKAHFLLKPGGYFISRFYADFPESKQWDFDLLVKAYLKKRSSPQNLENFWSLATFYSNLRRGRTMSTKFFFDALKQRRREPGVMKIYHEAEKSIPLNKEWTYFNWEQDKGMIEKYFTLERKSPEPRHSISYNWGYIMQFKKKRL